MARQAPACRLPIGRFFRLELLGQSAAVDDPHRAVFVLYQRGATLDPVATVEVVGTAVASDLGLVDVAANDPIQSAASGLGLQGLLEPRDVLAGGRDAEFDVL